MDQNHMQQYSQPFVMLAPMEGVIDSVMREIFSKMGGFDRFVSEFVRITDKVLPPHVFHKYAPELLTGGKTAEGIPVFIQLLGGQADVIAENAKVVVALGAPGIDLNFGCPAPTVNRHDGGATLLKNPHRVFDVVNAVRNAVPSHIPVTAKVRLGFDHKDHVLDIARAADEAGAMSLTVHARTRNEGYKPPAHWEYIAQMKSVVKKAVVIANGDIWSVEDYVRCREVSGCTHVALGRGAIAKPDLARLIKAHVLGEAQAALHWSDLKNTYFDLFMNRSLEIKDHGFALARSKQWLKHLGREYQQAAVLFETAKRASQLSEFKTSCEMNA